MKSLFTILLTIILLSFSQIINSQGRYRKEDLQGGWMGSVEAGGLRLRIIFNIKLHGTDSLSATMDSPDQGAKNIPMGKTVFADDTVKIMAPFIAGMYRGFFENDTLITGTWTQAGRKFTLDLRKQKGEFALKRPQEPKPPYPYRSEDVTFKNSSFGITLAGTLTIPEGKGPFPAVILISGSGAQNRDEALMGHKPFLVIADWLTRNGIAVLRYDDRGVGKSQGNYATANSADLATDAASAFEFLLSNSAVRSKAIGLMGHSEGGLIAPIVASKEKRVAFIVSLAGPGVTGEQLLYRQQSDISRLSGLNEEEIAAARNINQALYRIVINEKDDAKAEKEVIETYRRLLAEENITGIQAEQRIAQLKASFGAASYPWLRYFMVTDPASYWSKVKCPVLALNGEKDLQVAADENLPAIEAALRNSGNKKVTVLSLPDLNHLFQHCKTGLPAEYGQLEETFSPDALRIISDWINGLKGSR